MAKRDLKDDVVKMNVVGVLNELDNAIRSVENAKLWYTLGDIECVTSELDNLINQIEKERDFYKDLMLFI